mmetsp:Transcript_27402/g.50573  ORF Transcript_27402/g.50573 Transcript_27402/m.50573 type:complete len:95 (+) Transcript_27402:418-702(+)
MLHSPSFFLQTMLLAFPARFIHHSLFILLFIASFLCMFGKSILVFFSLMINAAKTLIFLNNPISKRIAVLKVVLNAKYCAYLKVPSIAFFATDV